jgi:copper oxidase (laccase) domain-containing protein
VNPDFDLLEYHGLKLLVYRKWWEQGIMHGMTTSQLSLVGEAMEHDFEMLTQSLGVSQLALLRQCHGSEVVEFRDAAHVRSMLARDGDLMRHYSGDAIAAPTKQILDPDVILYGVLTADCVPIVVRGDDGYVVIHAGWRGLANGIIGAGLRCLRSPREALIFASAGPDSYEVEIDVIAALGDSAVYRPVSLVPGKYLLDTVATSIKQLRNSLREESIHAAQVCTMSDKRFHSYRRDGAQSGRCMTFVVPR